MDDSSQELNGLSDSLSRVSSNALSAITSLNQTLASIDAAFSKSAESINKAGALMDKMASKLSNVGKTGERVKRSLSKTWVDVVSADILKKLDAEDKAFGNLANGVDRTTKRFEALKRSVKDGVIGDAQLEQSLNLLDGMDKQLQGLLGTTKKINDEGLSLDGVQDSVRDVTRLKQELLTLQMQSIAAGKALNGIDLDSDPIISQFQEVSSAFKDSMKEIQDEGSKYAKTLKDIFEGSTQGASATDSQKSDWDQIRKLSERYNGDLEKAARSLLLSRRSYSEMEKFNAKREASTRRIADLEVKAAKARVEKAGSGGMLGILSGFQSGGLMGGLSALGEARTNKAKTLLDQNISSQEKLKLAQSMGFNVTQDAKSGEYRIQSTFSQVLGKLAKNGIKGLGEDGGLGGMSFKDDGSIAKALQGVTQGATSSTEALAGVTTGAEGAALGAEGMAAGAAGAEGALVGVGGGATAAAAALGPLAVVAAALMGIFKIYAAVMDHAAKNYREVRGFGGVSGILGQYGRPSDLDQNARRFRTGLVKGGGDELSGYYLTFEKRLAAVNAAQAAGLNAGRMQDEVRGGYFQRTESGSMTGNYLMASAHYGELVGKDIKEASAEMANFHEELSMSFEGIDSFLMSISKSAVAAGVSNEKFLKITRSLANEQNMYSTSLQSTSRILQVLGQSGAYTSETLKKAFETLRGKDQSMPQRVFAAHQLFQSPESRKAVQATLNDQYEQTKERIGKLEEALNGNISEDKKDDIRKELNSLNMALPRLEAAKEAVGKGESGALDFAALLEDLPDAVKMHVNFNQLAKLPGGSRLGQLLQSGASAADLRRASVDNKFINDPMVQALGLNKVGDQLNAQLQLLEGASRSMKTTLFGSGETAGASQKAFIDKNSGSLIQALKSSGMGEDQAKGVLDKIKSGELTATGFKKLLYDDKKIQSKDFSRMANLSQKLVDLGIGSENELAGLRTALGASAQKAADTSDKIKAWAEPLMQTGNSFLDMMAGIMRINNKEAYEIWQNERNGRAQQRFQNDTDKDRNKISEGITEVHGNIVDLAKTAGVDSTGFTRAKAATQKAWETYTNEASIDTAARINSANSGGKDNGKDQTLDYFIDKERKRRLELHDIAAKNEGLELQKLGDAIKAKNPAYAPGVDQATKDLTTLNTQQERLHFLTGSAQGYQKLRQTTPWYGNTAEGNSHLLLQMIEDATQGGSNTKAVEALVSAGVLSRDKDKFGHYQLDSTWNGDTSSDKFRSLIKIIPGLDKVISGVFGGDDKTSFKTKDNVTIEVNVKNIITPDPRSATQ